MSNQITPNPSVPTQVVAEVKFPQFINNLGIIPTSYKDSMSYYETLAWLCKYLEETVIPSVNQNGNAVQELQNLYIELNNYVTHYFDTLDVQNEINNKLDEMVQSGELQKLLSEQYDELRNEVNKTIDQFENDVSDELTSMNSRISSITSGSPAGVYATLAALQSADPNHSRIYVVSANGYWYYYDNSSSQWTAGGVYQSSLSSDELTNLTNTTLAVNRRTLYDDAPVRLTLTDEVLSYSNGTVTATGDGTGWTDEYYYNVSDITEVKVSSGYLVYILFYNSDKTFTFGTSKNADFNLSNYPYKYVRFCIRKTVITQTLAEITALNKVTVYCKNRYLTDIQYSDIADTNYNEFLASGITEIVPDWKVGRITRLNELTEGIMGYRYLPNYFETKGIVSVSVPSGYRLTVVYLNYAHTVVHDTTYDGEGDFVPSRQYPLVRFSMSLINGRQFQDSIDINKNFKIKIDSRKLIENPVLYAKDICPKLASGTSTTSHGITYTSDGTNLHASGTATGYSYVSIYSNQSKLPDNIEPGKTYKLVFEGIVSRVNIKIEVANANGWVQTPIFAENYFGTQFTVPYTAIGMRIHVSVNNGYTVNGDYTPHIYAMESLEYATRFTEKSCKPMLTIIYDDGNKKFLQNIVPIIQAKKVPISTAVIVSEIENENPYAMTFDEIKQCYLAGAEVLVHSKERTEQQWGSDMYAIAYELRHAKHVLNNKGFNVPNCYVYSAASNGYPACIEAAKNEFACALTSGNSQSPASNANATNYFGKIDYSRVLRRWADTNWTNNEDDPEDVLKAWIDELVTNGTGWQIWTRHNYDEAYEEAYATILSNVIDYAIAQGIEIVTVEKGMQEYLNLS